MLRIVFSAEDMGRVRVASEPDFLWEISNSVQTLRRRDGVSVFDEWRRLTKSRVSGGSSILASLLPPRGYSPDFLTPTVGDSSIPEVAIDALLSTPRRRLEADLERFAVTRSRLPSWTAQLADGDLETLHQLGHAIDAYYVRAVAPYWSQVRAHVEADRIRRMHTLLAGGVEGLLSGLGPQIRWMSPVLEVDYPVDQWLHLNGRGITLQPSFFCWPKPVTLADSALPPVLVYPVHHQAGWASQGQHAQEGRSDPIEALIGRTRASLLRAARTGLTTSELARLLQVTAPAVSQHASVLREAGLLFTVREGGHSFHTTTAEGRALLSAQTMGFPHG